jgi:hypothetical protein
MLDERVVADSRTSPTRRAAPPGGAVSIASYLARARTLVYRRDARRAAWWTIAGLGTLAVAVPLVGSLLGGDRATAFAIVGTAGLAAAMVVVVAIVLGVIAPRRRYAHDADMARWVGKRHRPVASDLLSSIELATARERPGAPSPQLVEALIDATARQLRAIDPEGLIAPDETHRARRYALVAIAANVAFLALAPHAIFHGWRQLLVAPTAPFDGAKLSNVPLVGDLRATLAFPAYAKRRALELDSSSGDLRGLPGTIATLRARVLVPATSVELVVEPAAGGGDPRTIGARLDRDQLSATLVIDRAARYRFAVTAPGGSRSIEATPRTIETEPDQPPVVQLMAPADTLDVTNMKRVELAYVIEDDFGIASAELVWESGRDRGKKPIALGESAASGRAQGKLMWDIAEINIASGGDVRYWIEAKDNDTVGGPNVGRSRELHLHVTSPRERHEETLARQQAVAEKLVKNLGGRLVNVGDDTRDELSRGLREVVVELGGVASAYDKDPHASEALRKALAAMRERLDKLATAEQKLLAKPAQQASASKSRFAALDPKLVGELEDDALALADWLDRERIEGLLDIADEIAAHHKRLADLLAQYQRTKDPRLLDEIEREKRALDRLFAEQDKLRRTMPEDVLDQYVNHGALQAQQGARCTDEVSALVRAGKIAEAQKKLEQCRQQQERSSSSLEGSLASYRGDKFSEEQKKLDEVLNELSDVAKDQSDIAAEANKIFESYAQKADELARGNRREAAKKVGALVDKLKKRLESIDEAGLTPFAKEELDIVSRRLADVEHMVGDGDLAEALAMAKQAKQSLDTIAGELDAALGDDPKSKWTDATRRALDGVERSRPLAKDLVDELGSLSPKPEQIMSGDDQRALDRLRRRQSMNRQRAQKLGERTKQLGGDLPGDAATELGKRIGTATDHMGVADDRMKARDPSGTRESTRAAADALAKARDRARRAARQAQEGVQNSDEPIRIPGAEEYRAPEKEREELLEAAKKKPPEEFRDQVRRYYEEIRK